MPNSLPTGFWGSESPGDHDPDAALPAGLAESLLGGRTGDGRASTVPAELRPLSEALAALVAPPSVAELRDEEAALAAFRSMYGLTASPHAHGEHGQRGERGQRGQRAERQGRAEWPDGPAHTLPLEIPPELAAHQPRRARHAGPGRARRRRRSSPARRLLLATVPAAALVVAMGIFAYSGNLPEPIQSAAHVAIGAPSARHQVTGQPTASAAGAGGLSGSSATPVAQPTGTPSASSSAVAPAPAQGPRQWCQAFFANPWRPGSTTWDKPDFARLEKVAGSPWLVLSYCEKYLPQLKGQAFRFPNGDGGSLPWTPTAQPPWPAHPGSGPGGPGTVPDIGSTPGPGSPSGAAPKPASQTNQAGQANQAG